MRNAFRRAVAFVTRKPFLDEPTHVPLKDIKHYLKIDSAKMTLTDHFPVRINHYLRINAFQRPALTRGFESHPKDIVWRKKNPNVNDPNEEYAHSSPAIISTDYKELTGKHHFAIIVYPRLHSFGDDLFVAFGLTGHYKEDGELDIESIVLPTFDAQRCLSGSDKVPVTPDNLEFAMTFARICAEQIYAAQPVTLQRNYLHAEGLVGKGVKRIPGPSGPAGPT